jgi:SAM-dependent methyltransferase
LHIDFSYPWWLSYGHLPIAACAIALLISAFLRRWSVASKILLSLLTLWSVTGFVVEKFVFDANRVPDLPTPRFLASGSGRVLDMGAGTGRSSIMVLKARPQATLVAVDLFGDSFRDHFGRSVSPQQKLLDNLKTAGVDQRTSIETADVRKLPFPASSFDGIVSAYTLEHLNRKGTDEALAEAARVLKPGGDFLLMVVEKEFWGWLTFGPLLAHGGSRGAAWWTTHVRNAGFQVLEEGMRPLTLFVLARRDG